MINFIKKISRLLTEKIYPYQNLQINAENECQAMSCGLFNPELLTSIKKCKIDQSEKGSDINEITENNVQKTAQ